jgi:hypothetical protein
MKPIEMIEQGRFLGEEFLVWLWQQGLVNGGQSGEDGDQSALFLDDPLQLASERGDVKDLHLAKGNPAESREAFEALSRGMHPIRAKIRILSGDMEWTGALDASTLSLTSCKLPPTQSKDSQGRLSDRLFLLEEVALHLERRFARFVRLRTEDPQAMTDSLRSWIRQGLSADVEVADV